MKSYIKNIILKINILFVIIIFLSGCSLHQSENTNGKINVVTVNFVQYDFARAICGDRANVKMIMKPGAEAHGYEPTLSDIIDIEEADVFIYNAGETDVWIDTLLSSVDTSDTIIVSLMNADGITLYEEESIFSTHSPKEHTHHHSHDNNGRDFAYDEHIWTSPKNAIPMTKAICDALIKADNENREYYLNNLRDFTDELKILDYDLSSTVANSKTKLIAVADRFPFLYMAKDYGLKYMAAFSLCSAEGDAGPSVIAHMIEEIKRNGIDTVFYIEMSNEKMADVICEHTGSKKALLHSCQSISRADFDAGVTYVDLMKNNIKNLKEALN